jgi:hypothetical protein
MKIAMSEQSEEEQELEREGWQFVSMTGGTHLQRTLEMYKELGIETMLAKIDPTSCQECTQCFSDSGEELFRIYIRPSQD